VGVVDWPGRAPPWGPEGIGDSAFGAGVSMSALFCSTATGCFVFVFGSVAGLATATCCFFNSSILARARSEM